jgi:hypothetical protein
MDHLDLELKNYLQDWVDRQPLPANGRSRLLKSAAAGKEKGRKNSPLKSSSQPDDFISWALVYCVDRRISTARIVT